MARRMSVNFTLAAVQARTKTVTRRTIDTWGYLKAGDELVLVEKQMGLQKGEKQKIVDRVRIVSVTVEPIVAITPDEIAREGFDPADWPGTSWAEWWAKAQKVKDELDTIMCRRIEWEYLNEGETE